MIAVVERDYENHEMFCCKVIGRWPRMLKRKFECLVEAKVAAQKFAFRIVREIEIKLGYME